MNVKPYIVGALAFLILRGSQKINAVQRFVYDLAGLPTASVSNGKIHLLFNLLVTNKSSEVFDVTKLFSRILSNGVYIGELTSLQSFSIGKYSTVTIPLSLTLELTNAAVSLVGLLGGQGGGLTLTFEGYIQSRSLTVPISFAKKVA